MAAASAPPLFAPPVPDGFEYRENFLSTAEEASLLEVIGATQFSQVVMRGAVARRRTIHYGWTYGYYSRRTEPGPPLPAYLVPVRHRIAVWVGVDADRFVEALITEYPRGATIGWHRDAPMFGDLVAGVSLASPCRMKFRPYVSPADTNRAAARRTTHEVHLAPRSAYLLSKAARQAFEHSIPPVNVLRYSITFRTLRPD